MKNNLSFLKTAVVLALLSAAGVSHAADSIDYHTDIAPLLRDYCSGCHNDLDMEGDFSVETFRSLMKGGETEDKTMVVPGKAGESFLLHTLKADGDPAMPPEEEPQPTDDEIALLARWIEDGAKGPGPKDDKSILATLSVPQVAPRAGTARAITAMEFSPDGSLVATAVFGKVEIKDAATGKEVRSIPHQLGKVNAIHFSPDGKFLVTASGITGLRGVATVFSVETGEKVREVGDGAHRDILFDAEVSPDGKLIATAGYDRIIRIWEFATGKYVKKFPSHNGAIFDLAFSPDSALLVSASGDSTGKVWQVESGDRLDTLNQPQGEQFCIDVTPDGRFIVGAGADNRIRLWRLLSKDKPRINPVVHARFAHEDTITEFALSRNGKWLATASADRQLKLWQLPAVRQVKVFEEQPDLVSVLAFDPEKDALHVGRLDGSLQTYDFDAKSLQKGGGGMTDTYSEEDDNTIIAAARETSMVDEVEGEEAQPITVPARIKGTIGSEGDTDVYRFTAKKGEEWILQVSRDEKQSPLDSKVEVLTADGEPIERVVLQAMRDSWFTFRGKDSDTSSDFRVQNWREMELNEYLYANGEVVKLHLYPRGPDSGFNVYPGFGNRHTYFGTTPLAHPLGEPCYIVRPLPPGSQPSPNGLPVYRVYYENDDDPERRLGANSKLTFVAPEDGEYVARITDARGFGGEKYAYELAVRPPAPGYTVKIDGKNAKVSPGSGKEIEFTATREDGYNGPIEIKVEGLPKGFSISEPVTIEAGQLRAYAVLNADKDVPRPPKPEPKKMSKPAEEPKPTEEAKAKEAPKQAAAKADVETTKPAAKAKDEPKMEAKAEKAPDPMAEAWKLVKVTATATIRGKEVVKELGDLGKPVVGADAKLLAEVFPDGESGKIGEDGILEFEIKPGETISALVKVIRFNYEGRITFGKEDSGRNLPHGLYVDNIGLSGLMIPEGNDQQRFFITAADWVPETTRLFHLEAKEDGKQVTKPVRIRVASGEKGKVAGK